MEQKKLFLLDAYALIFRAYHAMKYSPRFTSGGMNTSAIFGFVNTLEEVLRKENPTHIAVCFDPAGKRSATRCLPTIRLDGRLRRRISRWLFHTSKTLYGLTESLWWKRGIRGRRRDWHACHDEPQPRILDVYHVARQGSQSTCRPVCENLPSGLQGTAGGGARREGGVRRVRHQPSDTGDRHSGAHGRQGGQHCRMPGRR